MRGVGGVGGVGGAGRAGKMGSTPRRSAHGHTILGGAHSWPEAEWALAHCAAERHERVYHTEKASPGVREELLPTVSRHFVSCRRTEPGTNHSAALCATCPHWHALSAQLLPIVRGPLPSHHLRHMYR